MLFIPGPTSGLVDGLVGHLHEVERIDALANVGRLLAGRFLEGESHIQSDGLEFRDSLGPNSSKRAPRVAAFLPSWAHTARPC
jgi:hypothetical protein